MTQKSLVHQIPEVASLMKDADHIDIKTIDGDLPMRAFIANMLSYQPKWMTFLYRVRWVFVRLLGMKQSGVPQARQIQPDDISLTPGNAAASLTPGDAPFIFTVDCAEDERYWFAGASESHLTAYLGVVVEPGEGLRKRFHVITIVHYHNWTGPVYFNVIRPFHHFVVRQMMGAAMRQPMTA